MNWLLIIVLVVIALNVMRGYRRGLLRMAYSMVSWIIVWVLVAWATPYISNYIINNTGIYQQIAEHCEEVIQQTAAEKAETQITGAAGQTEEQLAGLGINLPENVLSNIVKQSTESADTFLAESGIYSELANSLARFVVQGISFLIASVFAGFVVQMLSRVLGIVSHIPIIHGVNRTAGLFAGGIYGMFLVWIAFYIIALFSTSETGRTLISYIYQSQFLTTIYENNPIVSLVLYFL